MGLRTLRSMTTARACLALFLLFAASAANGVLSPARAQSVTGATINVNSFADVKQASDGLCTLREAIIAANSDSAPGNAAGECPAGNGSDRIVLPPGIYALSRSDSGHEDASTTGDLDVAGPVTIEGSGAQPVVIDGSGIAGRVFHVLSSDVVIARVTIRGGSAPYEGGGIYVDDDASVRLENVTIAGNHAGVKGGGVAVEGSLVLVNVTIVNNNAYYGDAIYNVGTLTMGNSIVGANGSSTIVDCLGPITASAPNVVVANACAAGPATIVADPKLIADLDGGGVPTFYRLDAGSPAIDAGAAAVCPATDQVGTTRPQRGACDAGAHEVPGAPPVALAGAVATNEDVPVVITLAGSGDDGNLAFALGVLPAKGALSGLTPTGATTATVIYTPSLNQNGPDALTFTVSDTLGVSDAATVTVQILPVNDAPVAANDSLTTSEDTPADVDVAANDSDVDGNLDAASVTIQSPPTRGVATPVGAGRVTYTPNANIQGGDAFVYQICDAASACATATVNVTVTPANDPPLAGDDAYTVAEDASLSRPAPGVLQNDSDPDGDSLAATLLTAAAHGVVTVQANGAFVYTPNKHYDGGDSFAYTLADGKGGSDSATVSLTVTPDAFYEVTGTNDSGSGSLRAAIERANSTPGVNTIVFDVAGAGPHQINLLNPLPAITDPVVIDGTTQPQGDVVLDGGGKPFACLVLVSGGSGSTIRGLTIQNCGSHGILIDHSANNTIDGNTIRNNGGDGIHILGDPNDIPGSGANAIVNNVIVGNHGNGVTIIDSVDNNLANNDIHGNAGLSVDLGGDGPTPNDPGDEDTGANYKQNYPALVRAVPANPAVGAAQAQAVTGQIVGWMNSRPNEAFTIRVYAGPSCSDAQQRLLVTTPPTVTTDADGMAYIVLSIESPIAPDEVVHATATDATGNTSEYSDCIIASLDNDSWPRAMALDALNGPAPVEQYLDLMGQARWYRFRVQPHSQATVVLSNLPANYDLTIYKDIAKTYQQLTTAQDTVQLSAEFAPQAFSPQAFSPQAFSPQAFSPQAFSPQAFSPQAFSPQAFSPQAFSPQAFSPQAFSTDAYLPTVLDPESFSGAQTRSIIGVSALDGNAGEGISINTWTNDGDFYVRVRGRDGAFTLDAPYSLTVQVKPGPCNDFMALPALPATNTTAPAGNAHTLILWDDVRLRAKFDGDAVDALRAQLESLAARPEVAGVIVDVSKDARVATANQRADDFMECVYAKNQVVQSIKAIVDRYRANNPVQYVVIVGSDEMIPFFRYPDNALLGHESDYVPPVKDDSASQASLRLGYVLNQDVYGSRVMVSLNATEFPIPELPVGRLVETPSDMMTLVAAYLSRDGVALSPASSLVTGYDFLEDAALEVRDQLAAGIGAAPDALITPREISPLDSRSWTAEQLKAQLQTRHDIIFLAGHFNAASALAADYRTSLLSTDVLANSADMTNALIYSAGCHAGYNIVNDDGVAGVTFEPDWAQTFARKGATLVAGTGYQYGDTDFIEYSERLYLEFTKQLRMGSGPVAVGDALVAAKLRYLATTPTLKGAHEKSLLEATLFGLPMFAINMPGQRLTPGSETPLVTSLTPVASNPGQMLGLKIANLTVKPTLAVRTLELTNLENNTTVVSTWLEGDDGVVTNPAQPALPLVIGNVSVPGHILRGAGLRGGVYTDTPNVTPLTGAPVTELRGVHSPFQSDVYFPVHPWGVNFFDLLVHGEQDGVTRLWLTPAQYQSSAPGSLTSTRRAFSQMDVRLFYVEKAAQAAAAPASLSLLADMPTIVRVEGEVLTDTVEFRAWVVGNPAVGIQNVWVTYTAIDGPLHGTWQSLDLVQDGEDSTTWKARLQLNGRSALSLRYIVQAVNGLGMVSLVDNIGRYYIPGVEGEQLPTVLTLEPLVGDSSATVNSGAFGTTVQFAATLKQTNGAPLVDQPVTFGIGPQTRLAMTDQSGRAQAAIPLLGMPGTYPVQAAFAGTAQLAAASAISVDPFTIELQTALLSLNPVNAVASRHALDGKVPAGATTATLIDGADRRLVEQTVFFTLTPMGDAPAAAGATPVYILPVITNLVGEAKLGALDLPNGAYTVAVTFDGAASHTPAAAQGTLDIVVPTADPIPDEPMILRQFLPVVDR